MRRGGLEGVEGCRERALQQLDESHPLVADADMQSRDRKTQLSEKESVVSSEKELRLAAEAVEARSEASRLQAEMALRAEGEHRA